MFQSRTHRLKKNTKACHQCQKIKKRCIGPSYKTCERCANKGLNCNYSEPTRQRGPKPKQIPIIPSHQFNELPNENEKGLNSEVSTFNIIYSCSRKFWDN
ncbi:hypothetical protein F8M41_021563 [Gigaspora margarita]|uniref:Zn(2)-C6 fungal-type domain-containing protein n=1 Tax=Gigaspora margarita TaxID=4874 RepID=A0A8H4AGK5_GIGMA|nr:hypothetical protein F8M41_021563 [Gigaspora margarita]